MRVLVTLMADMRRFAPRGARTPLEYELGAGATVDELLSILGIPEELDITIGVDGELGGRDTPLRDGSDVMIVSPMEGG
jgi:sulfur carrier protein ThiS